MDDQGEKIIFLARELLNSGMAEPTARRKSIHVTMDFKTLCLTTLLAAAGGGLVTGWLHEDSRPINRLEKTEIDALIFYAAKVKGIDESALRREVETQIGATRLDDMSAQEFPAARRYLQEKAQ